MSSDNKVSDWKLIIEAVKTPLGFFTFVVLVLDGILVITAASTDRISMLAPLVLLGLVIVLVFVIVWIKPEILQFKAITVTLTFCEPCHDKPAELQKVKPIEVGLDITECVLEIRDEKGNVKHSRTPNLTFGPGGWAFRLTEYVGPNDNIRLELVERNGRKWEVRPFYPDVIDRDAIKIF